jgi:hypothetical protein
VRVAADASREDFVSVPVRMTLGLVGGIAAGVVLGLLALTSGSAAGWVLIAAAGGPLFVLLYAHHTARENRRRKVGAERADPPAQPSRHFDAY